MNEEQYTVLLIQLTRIYEVQMALLNATDANMAAKMEQNHKLGLYKSPLPAMLIRDEHDEPEPS